MTSTFTEAIKQKDEEQQAKAMEAQERQQKNTQMGEVKPPNVNISFKDLPPAGQIQAAAKYGIELSSQDVMAKAVSEGSPQGSLGTPPGGMQ